MAGFPYVPLKLPDGTFIVYICISINCIKLLPKQNLDLLQAPPTRKHIPYSIPSSGQPLYPDYVPILSA